MEERIYGEALFRLIKDFLEANAYLNNNFELNREYVMDKERFRFDLVILSKIDRQPVYFFEVKATNNKELEFLMSKQRVNKLFESGVSDFSVFNGEKQMFLVFSNTENEPEEKSKPAFLDYLNEYLSDKSKELGEKTASGIEAEEMLSENVPVIREPYSPEKIKISQQLLSIKYMFELYEDGLIELSPDFQRQRVWKNDRQKSRLIESLILNIPIPAFYMYETEEGGFQIIDGQQRLDAIFGFLQGKFRLKGLEYLNDYEGLAFADLSVKLKGQIYRTQLSVNTIDITSPKRVVYDIFKRINTGGVPLNNQEMRNAISSPAVREFYKRCRQSEEFLLATCHRVGERRLEDQELVLRFVAFYRIYDFENQKINYEHSSIVDLLNETHEFLLDHPEEFDAYEKAFKRGLMKSYELFERNAFNKYVVYEDGSYRPTSIINKPLYSAFTVLLADPKYQTIDFSQYQKAAEKIMVEKIQDYRFFNAISIGTNNRGNVRILFEEVKEVIEQCLRV
ncbi:DUF262 domain-containing protein [Enterococcus sp. LJL128]|uniref:DUF262 domain-containing protein n=1 Tax=Enterococcus sp. LJL51 TaxID=3416656 RepID=UPI003CF16C50